MRFAERRLPRQLPARGRALTGPPEIRFPGRSCLKRFESRLTPWVAMSAHRSLFPAQRSALTRHPDTEFLLFGDSALIEVQLAKYPGAESSLARHSHRRRRQHARQAEPGAAPRPQELVDVAGDRRRQEGRGRCRGIRRQHRRADGDGAILPAHAARHRPAGAGGDLADRARRFGGARSRRHHRRRCASSGGAGGDGQRHGERAVRPRSGRPSACSISASRKSRAARKSARPPNCCAR